VDPKLVTPEENAVAVLSARLRQAVQGCTVHGHGPVQAWRAIEEAARAGGATREAVAREASGACRARLRELRDGGVPDDDARAVKERTTLAFIRALYADVLGAAATDPMAKLERDVEPEMQAVLDHRLYAQIKDLDDVRRFMQHHVFAVWDFMCLLKSLQRMVTCVDPIWRPVGDPVVRRLINEIVVGEESDVVGTDTLSHFELYLWAMTEVGADTKPAETFVRELQGGSLVSVALEGAPPAARDFVLTTLEIVHRARPHEVAAAFTLGREAPIPGMFKMIITGGGRLTPGADDLLVRAPKFLAYLERHVKVDGEEHGPAARRLLTLLCGDDEIKWEEATDAARRSLRARRALWDAIAPRRLEVVPEQAVG